MAQQATLVLLVGICLTALIVLAGAAENWAALQMGRSGMQVRWDFRDYVEYAGWLLGFRANAPFVYYADEIQKIRPESTIPTDEGNVVEAPVP